MKKGYVQFFIFITISSLACGSSGNHYPALIDANQKTRKILELMREKYPETLQTACTEVVRQHFAKALASKPQAFDLAIERCVQALSDGINDQGEKLGHEFTKLLCHDDYFFGPFNLGSGLLARRFGTQRCPSLPLHKQ